MTEFLAANWEWILLAFYVTEKIVRLSPSKKDDVIFDMVLKPVWEAVTKGKSS
jgi:hypothetical protein